MNEATDDSIRDAGMLAAAQAVEHYEISRYGTLAAWAEKMQMQDAAHLLHATPEEETATDQKTHRTGRIRDQRGSRRG
jgi:ferritin-like metal-binding protein YciE